MTLHFEPFLWEFVAAGCDRSWELGYGGKTACTQLRCAARDSVPNPIGQDKRLDA